MPAPQEVINLVEHFQRNLKDYQSGRYNETQVRLQFIDPFFEALGWDVHNRKGYAEAYKDVVHEDQVKVGGATKAPDYGFRIGGARKFFVEAKKPSINIKDDVHPAYQLRRYAWSAKLPLSILTDFEELAVYDCRIRPVKTDNTGTARVMYFTFDEYMEKWDEIASKFSRESVLQGSFDRYAESSKRKRGTAEVDTAFLAEIERWREILARNIALRNRGMTVRDLNFAVQRTIDRIIFLRIAEDRGLEPYGRLRNLGGQKDTYNELCQIYRRADERYNSSLFHFKSESGRHGYPDELTVGLQIDDKVIQDVLRNLYYPDSPYEFSVLPGDILGQVYEQFLGKVIRLTSGGRAKVEDKPEVKKAGGVYYTPTYIVDYIVAQTVGKLLEGLTPREASKIKICDPACGSGSFLLGAYQHLLDWHRDYYIADDPEKWAKTAGRRTQTLYQAQGGEWRLTTAEKRRILLNNIYGVDIDPQAVEVTKLSLLLKVLEGENEGSLAQQLAFFQERALPDLDSNIKCGNSLIGPDYFQAQLIPDEGEISRVNPFDWKTEFKDVFTARGFDVVIGNPPYLFITELHKLDKDYFAKSYKTYSYRFDVYGLFIEKSVDILLNKNGKFGFIIPHTLLNNDSFEHLRRLILEETSITKIIDLGPGVFLNAKNETMLIFFKNTQPTIEYECKIIKSDKNLARLEDGGLVNQRRFLTLPRASILLISNPKIISILEKLRNMKLCLGDLCTINQGLRTGNNRKYLSNEKMVSTHRPVVGGKNIDRYFIRDFLFVQYEPLKLDAPRKESIFTSPEKLIAQEVRNITLPRRLVVAYDNEQLFSLQTTNVINLKDDILTPNISLRYILGLINSTLLNWFFRLSFPSNNHIASNH